MRILTLRSSLVLTLWVCVAAVNIRAAEDVLPEGFPKLDAEKYPQDTPEHALSTVAKALTAEDFAYFTAWIVTPDSTQRTLEKFKTLDAAVADQKINQAKIAGRKAMLETITRMQADKLKQQDPKAAEKGEPVRFTVDDASFMQFEKQKDGRWCLNPKARSAK